MPLFLFVFIAGCNTEYVNFNGESENWKGQYRAHIDDNSENGVYTFRYKGATENVVLENLKIVINGGESVLKETRREGATVKMSSACSGCAVTDTKESIKVEIEWGGKEEDFLLEPN
ncbi:hypothetical protein [Thalassobacillus pellis]|uniref:hypothetical protein n=1 Tax=Thalassobacillus pellis TaxID=748008 RepID=UPI001961BEBA|nr:hypothetical protein [Thalassobacillus pellis]MBM7553919.1 hypothetical protein [Thalassobacillus pellis]